MSYTFVTLAISYYQVLLYVTGQMCLGPYEQGKTILGNLDIFSLSVVSYQDEILALEFLFSLF